MQSLNSKVEISLRVPMIDEVQAYHDTLREMLYPMVCARIVIGLAQDYSVLHKLNLTTSGSM